MIRGNYSYSGGLRLDGKIYGDLTVEEDSGGTLIMGEQSRIKGSVMVETAIIAGEVIGNVVIDYTVGTGTLTTPQADMISIDNNSLTLPASSIIGIADTRTGPLSFSVIASSDSGHLQINSSNLTIKQIA